MAGVYSGSSSLAFTLILLNVLPLTNLELTSPYTDTWVCIYIGYNIFPLLILRLKCTYDTGYMGQAVFFWSLKSSWVLCRISRISAILVVSFTLTSEFSDIKVLRFLVYDRIYRVKSASRDRIDGLSCVWTLKLWCLLSHVPRKNSFNFQNVEQEITSDQIIIKS